MFVLIYIFNFIKHFLSSFVASFINFSQHFCISAHLWVGDLLLYSYMIFMTPLHLRMASVQLSLTIRLWVQIIQPFSPYVPWLWRLLPRSITGLWFCEPFFRNSLWLLLNKGAMRSQCIYSHKLKMMDYFLSHQCLRHKSSKL